MLSKTRIMYLRIKINAVIINELLRIFYILTNYIKLFKSLINIDLHLQNTNALLKLNLHQVKNLKFYKNI